MAKFHLIVASTLSTVLTFAATAESRAVKIEGLDRMGIAYAATAVPFTLKGAPEDVADRHPTDNSVLKIELKMLTGAQIEALSKLAGVKPSPRASYILTDFMPPAIQALDGRQFEPIKEKYKWPDFGERTDDVSVEVEDLINYAEFETPLSTLINCWTTTYEILRTWKSGDRSLDITWLSRTAATTVLTESHTTRVSDHDLKFGDLIVFAAYDDGPGADLVQHTAIYVLPGLYFEKTDSTANDAFRFVLATDLIGKYKSIFGSKLKQSHYRLKSNAVLPRLMETRNMAAADRELYGKYFSEADLKSISLEFDWIPSMSGISRPEFFPFRLHTIELVNTQNGYDLDRSSVTFRSFARPVSK